MISAETIIITLLAFLSGSIIEHRRYVRELAKIKADSDHQFAELKRIASELEIDMGKINKSPSVEGGSETDNQK